MCGDESQKQKCVDGCNGKGNLNGKCMTHRWWIRKPISKESLIKLRKIFKCKKLSTLFRFDKQ